MVLQHYCKTKIKCLLSLAGLGTNLLQIIKYIPIAKKIVKIKDNFNSIFELYSRREKLK